MTMKKPKDEDLETIRLLQSGLDSLDALTPVDEPSLEWFETRIAEHEGDLRKRFVRDLSLFLAVACFVLFGMAASLLNYPAVFITLQAVVLLAAPAFLVMAKDRKRVN